MYCPVEFETLASAYHRVGSIASRWSLAQPRIDGPIFPEWGTDETEGEFARREAYREWLWRRFAQHTAGRLFVTSPQGVPIKLDIFASNFWASAATDFPEDIEEQAELAKRQGDIYYHVRPGTFTVDVEHTPLDEDDQHFGETLVRLDGWPVCWRPSDDQITDKGLEASLLATSAHDDAKMLGMPSRNRGPGQPKRHDGVLEEVVVNWFSYLNERGELRGKRREELLFDAIVFAERAFKETVPRSTMQRYLKPVFAEVDAQN